jgi:hypothetical protein
VNNNKGSSRTFYSLEPGAKYMITAWGLGGRSDKRRSHSPAVVEVIAQPQNPSPPRDLTITRVFQHGIELNWIPPKWPNGKIEHYILQYVPNGAAMEEIVIGRNFTHYNITGLKRGQTYNVISVDTVNLAGRGSRNKIYKHNPRTSGMRLCRLCMYSTTCDNFGSFHSYSTSGKLHFTHHGNNSCYYNNYFYK